MSENNIVVGCKSWNKEHFDQFTKSAQDRWEFIADKESLNEAVVDEINPKYIFFLHWSYKVPKAIFEKYDCICFHMTDLPFGRGGSPLQNLIVRGYKDTFISAFKMVEDYDAGPIYLKKKFSLSGSAQEILIKASELSFVMIEEIVLDNIPPKPQEGEVVLFKRRRKEQSEIKEPKDISSIYDYIRMLDAEGYPKAFIELDGFKFEFDSAKLNGDEMVANVKITSIKENK
ncbi:MAG: methionyl-tRNA formyltransferase [Planctomycetota bacterium]|nr:MAG: methionyl-tRNA formyltransferase [Planctomycetota bacterium]